MTTGEEELLANYLTHMNEAEEHDFVFPSLPGERAPDSVFLDQGYWDHFQKSPERAAQVQHDEISYMWDVLIERFAQHALQGTQYFVSEGGFHDSEKILRFMASEPRLVRRAYSEKLVDVLETVGPSTRHLTVLSPLIPGHPYYMVAVLPVPASRPYSEYRDVRQKFLYACCLVLKLNFPDATDIVGIAMAPAQGSTDASEDACYFNARTWSKALEDEARSLQRDLGIFQNLTASHRTTIEYPVSSDK